jgi:hypothetical protein
LKQANGTWSITHYSLVTEVKCHCACSPIRLADMRVTAAQQTSTGQKLPSLPYLDVMFVYRQFCKIARLQCAEVAKLHEYCVGLTIPPQSVRRLSKLSRQCGILNISQPYRPPRPVTGIALFYGDGVSFTLWRRSVLPVRYELDCKYCYK